MRQVVLASGNAGKLKEFGQQLLPLGIELLPQGQFIQAEAAETGLTFVENALIKARHASASAGLPALADDSGLAVDALDGAPGIHSARYAGASGEARDGANNAKLLAALEGLPPALRGAEFICVLAYLRHPQDPCPIICQGRWRGQIASQAQGHQGFGYDPLFWLPEQGLHAAELSREDKLAVSHRGRALAQLQAALAP